MSLETASFIKALNANNPEGTDPKSQGDDHLRMIKAVLQSQFSGFTDGAPITLTESQLNAAMYPGRGSAFGLGDVAIQFLDANAITTVCGYFTVAPGAINIPAGTTPGDCLFQALYDANSRVQILVQKNGNMYSRGYSSPAWSAWLPMTPLGVGQSWQSYLPSRAVNTNYTNNDPRPIQVSVTAATPGASSSVALWVAGIMVQQFTSANSFDPVSVCAIIPPGHTYAVNVSGAITVAQWAELR